MILLFKFNESQVLFQSAFIFIKLPELWAFFYQELRERILAIANIKPNKFITYRQPKLSTTTKQVSTSLLNASSSVANKITRGLAKHQSETNKTTNRYTNIMGAQQSINFNLWRH